MIPDRDDFWMTTPPASNEAASGQLLLLDNDPSIIYSQETNSKTQTAWTRYQNFVAAMDSQGRKFNNKLVIEAMFRGNNLVYSATSSNLR